MITTQNRVMLSDSYKYSHPRQYPANTVSLFDYAEARSGKVYDKTVFFGLQYILKQYFTTPITIDEVEEAKMFADAHGIDFEYDGWKYIAEDLQGKLPVIIRAIPEGKVIPVKNALFTVESNDPKVFWVASWMETILMKVWYTSNVATRSYYVRKGLEEYAEETQENPFVAYSYHNFGDRGSSSVEAAAIGGMAQLAAGFMGTDNFNALRYVKDAYNTPEIETIGHSIPATEHSSTTAWTKEKEMDMIMNHLENNKGKAIIAAVMDSYDYFKAVKTVCAQEGEFQKKINSDEYPVFVMRPDSGNPAEIIPATLDIMEEENVPFTVNSKGFKVFNKMRIIWGDGINTESIKVMLDILVKRGYSSENIAFGSGGWLMQQHDRDTQGWAVKCSSITVAEPIEDEISDWDRSILVDRDVYKDPITAPGKKSKRGKMTTYYNPATNVYFTDNINIEKNLGDVFYDIMETVYENGEMKKEYTIAEVRANNA